MFATQFPRTKVYRQGDFTYLSRHSTPHMMLMHILMTYRTPSRSLMAKDVITIE